MGKIKDQAIVEQENDHLRGALHDIFIAAGVAALRHRGLARDKFEEIKEKARDGLYLR